MPIVLTAADISETRAAMAVHVNPDGTYNSTKVAKELGVSRSTAQNRIDIVKNRYFQAPKIPTKNRSVEEIRAHRRSESQRAREYEAGTKLLNVKIKTPGPVGFMAFGDPHIDNPGSDWDLFERHLAIAAKRPAYVFAGNIGDIRDNWVGRLTRLFSDHTINSKESWALAEWVFRDAGVSWAWLIRGNHDEWSGDNDPLDWIARDGGVGVDQSHGARIAFHHPNGAVTRMHARHDFQGNSIFNPLHALKRETLHGYRDHIIVAGHRHTGADARDMTGDGLVFTMCRISGYKISDDYARQIGAHPKHLHPAALFVVDPDKADGDASRVWTAPDIETGVDYLDFLRRRFERKR
jgi:hypothetical protein